MASRRSVRDALVVAATMLLLATLSSCFRHSVQAAAPLHTGGRLLHGLPFGTRTPAPTPGPQTNTSGASIFTSTTINLPISNNTQGVTSSLTVGIPPGTAITAVNVTINLQHPFGVNLVINLKAPNSLLLNLLNDNGTDPRSKDFTGTIFSSDSTRPLSAGTSPYTGAFAPDAIIGVGPPSTVSNVPAFPSLYSEPNGQWVLVLADFDSITPGTLFSWSISVAYSSTISPIIPGR